MVIGYIISWSMNVIVISMVLALVAEVEGIELETRPVALAIVWLGLPTMLEIVCFYIEGQSFLSLIVPWLSALS